MNEKVIWDYLIQKTNNPYGTAAIMGNLMAESSLNPSCATGKNKTANYVSDADNGVIDFENDGVAFGLVQWCYHTRKAALRELAKQREKSVGNIELQLEYLWREMSEKYKSVWSAVCSAKNIPTASNVVMLQYEKPATTTEAARQKRANYGQKFFDQFACGRPQATVSGKKMVRATTKVNVRAGAGLDKLKVGSIAKGTSLEWIETKNGWHKVACWVSGDFSEVVE